MRSFSFATLLLGAIITLLHGVFVAFSLYWYFWWLDLPMHVIGGIWVVFLSQVVREIGSVPRSRLTTLKDILLFSLVFIVSWEIVGVWIQQGMKVGWLQDTSLDVLFGILGVMIGYWLCKRSIHE